MNRQLWILHIWLWCVLFISTPVTPLLDESNYADLTCAGATISDVGVDPTAIQADLTGPDNNLAFSYVCENFKYMFKCCGKIKRWKLIAGKTGTIQLQVWRRNDTQSYQLIGENYCQITATNPTETTCDVDEFDRILVRKGDFMGWHNQGNETLMYKEEVTTDSTLENLFRRINARDLYPGDTYDWSEVEAYNDRLYAIQAIYEESQNPTITAADMTVPDYINSGDTIGRITYQDPDYMDNSSLVVVSTQTSAYYTTDLPSGYVTANNAYRPRDDGLGYFVYDLCYRTASDTHTITVQETALIIDNLDATFTVSEATTTSTLLHTITVTDPVDEWYCTATWPTGEPFLLKAITTTSYGFYLVEHGGLDYSSDIHYSLPVECVENKAASTATATATIQVYVTKDQPPTITNLDASVAVDAETAVRGDLVFKVTATDPENEIVTFSMTCTSGGATVTDTFRILANGDVVLRKFLTLTSNYQFDCAVTATDSAGNSKSPNSLQIYITNFNNLVSINNMPPSRLQIMENMAVGTSLYKFEYSDVDTGTLDTKTWSLSLSLFSLSRYFSIDPDTGVLSLAFSEIDAETLGVNADYTVPITVGDVKSSATENLLIKIINENEPPQFTEDYYTIDALEGPDQTEITDGASLFTFNDEDLNDGGNTYEEHFYSLDCDNVTNTQRFFINRATGAIKYQGDYDIDTAGTPSDVECTITIADKYGLSDTAGLHIHIKNDNEFSPEFTHATYNFYLASNTLVGTYLTTVSAVDYDSSDDDDNEITYSLNHAAVPGAAVILAVNHNGFVYLAESLDTHIGSTLGPIEVLASNYGVASRTGTAYITIEIPSTTTTSTTTTDRNKDFYEDEWSYYWLLACLFGLTLIVVAITMIIFRICRLTRIKPCCYQCCMKGLCCREPPPPPRGFGDKGYDLASFGHRHNYVDEDAEVDGWLVTKRDPKKSKGKRGHYGTPNAGYDTTGDTRSGPIYEMFKVPSTSTVPKAASYLDPYTSTRNIPRSERKPLMNRP